MTVRIGLMGLGRVGRNLFRALATEPGLEIAAIRDTAEAESLVYLLRFDSVLGRNDVPLALHDSDRGYPLLHVGEREIAFFAGKESPSVDWGAFGVDVVIEATTRSSVSRAELERHLASGARRVLTCTPPDTPADRTVVMGINHDRLGAEDRIVSNGSGTAHCVAPVLSVLAERFGIERAFVSSVHAYSHHQRLADVPESDQRNGRAAAQNIVPQSSNAAQVLAEIMPALAGRISAQAINVPVANGSLVDLVCWHERPVSVESINEAMADASSEPRWRRYLEFEDEPIVSSDVIQSPYSSVFDSDATMTLGDRVSKTLCWFDNGWAYSLRAIELARRLAELPDPQAAAGQAAAS